MTVMAADLYGDIEKAPKLAWRSYLPGLIVALLGTLAAGFFSDRYGVPLTIMALLIGLALNFLAADARLLPGLAFASRSLLRWGIVCAGARVTLGQIAQLGPDALLSLIAIVGITIGSGILAARYLGSSVAFGTIAGGAAAICGASAALALATTLGEQRTSRAQLLLILMTISAASATAMLLYPAIAHSFQFNNFSAGFLMGASIPDVAQALGAGYSYSDEAGQVAAIVKLTRVAMLAPVLAIIAAVLPRGEARSKQSEFPWFVLGFFIVVGINSTGWVPVGLASCIERGGAGLLALAITATAIRAPLQHLLKASWKPVANVVIATLTAFTASLVATIWMIAQK